MWHVSIPNKYIKCNIAESYGLSRKFYVVYTMIEKYRSISNTSWITIGDVFDFFGYKQSRHKPKAYYEIVDILNYMAQEGMISVSKDPSSLNYDTGEKMYVLKEFKTKNKYTLLYDHEFEKLYNCSSPVGKENLLLTFLYVKSYIGEGKHSENNILAFYQSIETISHTTGMSKDVISKSLNYLSDPSSDCQLLVLADISSMKKNKYLLSNVYVLNQQGYEEEIEWAVLKLREQYGLT